MSKKQNNLGDTIRLSDLRLNPRNPRTIKDKKFEALVKSLADFPETLEKRPIVIDSSNANMILAGNQRYCALKELGYSEIPKEWVSDASNWSEKKKEKFVVLDNVDPYGDWDLDILKEDYDTEDLLDMGVLEEVDLFEEDMKAVEKKIVTEEIRPYKRIHFLISFHPDDYEKIQNELNTIASIRDIEVLQSGN